MDYFYNYRNGKKKSNQLLLIVLILVFLCFLRSTYLAYDLFNQVQTLQSKLNIQCQNTNN